MGATDRDRRTGRFLYRHGGRKNAAYVPWEAMIQRCYNKEHRSYPRYGGKGVTVCQRWRESFMAFLEDMGPRPSRAYTLDRIDGSNGYEPGNCRWATRQQQQRNMVSNHLLTFNGVTRCVVEWTESLSLPRNTIYKRLARKWSIERALTTPKRAYPVGGAK